MMDSEQSNTENPNTCAFAPADTITGYLQAFCYSQRHTPGDMLITVKLGKWTGLVPMHELDGLLDRIRATGV